MIFFFFKLPEKPLELESWQILAPSCLCTISLSPENLNNTQAQSTSIQQQLQPTQYSQKKSQTDDENASRSINERIPLVGD